MMISILISTKNRKIDLEITLSKISNLISRDDVECVVFDDGSDDDTFEFLQKQKQGITVLRNERSKGYLYCRNKMLNETNADYAISLDDDAHFLTDNVFENICDHFKEYPDCGVAAFRLFWGLNEPKETVTKEITTEVSSFVGCGHVWRMKAWHTIPNYPEWFVFYGEENFASLQLFKNNWKIYYLPRILVNHRVDLNIRKSNPDYGVRLRRSLGAGWNVFFLFYPLKKAIRLVFYSVWIQVKTKVLKGNYKAAISILKALLDLVLNFRKLLKQRNTLTKEEFNTYSKLENAKIYWKPNE
ncbi:glycosyltransferase family 2 protein [Algibacter sp. L1A34]|uniref:glycosyltransferase family 2 protein n=1 Tax=Algibacter sp. L1A34 TaxID=2686365 RepID=UPI00131B4154|nr:glycosyltransferase [Algibacter sp. L1A34]